MQWACGFLLFWRKALSIRGWGHSLIINHNLSWNIVAGKTKVEHKHDLAYYGKCPECDESYLGETGRKLQDQVDEHLEKNSKSNILRHSYQENHKNVFGNNFQILGNGYKRKFKWKLSEA